MKRIISELIIDLKGLAGEALTAAKGWYNQNRWGLAVGFLAGATLAFL